jgi:hypothetical protein
MAVVLSAKPEIILIDADAVPPQTTGEARISYDGDQRKALLFSRPLGKQLWDAIDPREKMILQGGHSQTEEDDAPITGDFLTDKLPPGTVIQYGILPPGSDLDKLDPTSQVVSDGRFAKIVTIFALLKKPGAVNFITEDKEEAGGTFYFRAIKSGSTDTVMALEVGRRPWIEDPVGSGIFRIPEPVATQISPALSNSHELEAGPLLPGQLYTVAVRLSDTAGHWMVVTSVSLTKRREVTVNFTELKILDEGDVSTGEADFRFEVIEGASARVETFVRPLTDITAQAPGNQILLNFTHVIGPKEVTEDTKSIGAAAAGHEHDPVYEGDEVAGTGIKFLSIPRGRGKEEVPASSPPTTKLRASAGEDEFAFEVSVTHSVKYVD